MNVWMFKCARQSLGARAQKSRNRLVPTSCAQIKFNSRMRGGLANATPMPPRRTARRAGACPLASLLWLRPSHPGSPLRLLLPPLCYLRSFSRTHLALAPGITLGTDGSSPSLQFSCSSRAQFKVRRQRACCYSLVPCKEL